MSRNAKVIDIAKDFTRYPAGRLKTDGPYSGEAFRQNVLVPALKARTPVIVALDGPLGYGSSFLEEAFGGLVRVEGFTPEQVLTLLEFRSSDSSLKAEITSYINDARQQH